MMIYQEIFLHAHKNKKSIKGLGMAKVVEYLPSKHEALISNPSNTHTHTHTHTQKTKMLVIVEDGRRYMGIYYIRKIICSILNAF
jgi:hypothetical protein